MHQGTLGFVSLNVNYFKKSLYDIDKFPRTHGGNDINNKNSSHNVIVNIAKQNLMIHDLVVFKREC